MSQPSQREKLDVESTQAREARLGQLLSSISSPKAEDSTSGSGPSSPPNPFPSRPFAVPESDVLARVKAFLPTFQASNDELLARASQDPESVNIEKVNGGQAIAMDLGLGVFDAPNDLRGDLGPVIDTQPPEGMSTDDEDESEGSDGSDSTISSDSEDDSLSAAESGVTSDAAGK